MVLTHVIPSAGLYWPWYWLCKCTGVPSTRRAIGQFSHVTGR